MVPEERNPPTHSQTAVLAACSRSLAHHAGLDFCATIFSPTTPLPSRPTLGEGRPLPPPRRTRFRRFFCSFWLQSCLPDNHQARPPLSRSGGHLVPGPGDVLAAVLRGLGGGMGSSLLRPRPRAQPRAPRCMSLTQGLPSMASVCVDTLGRFRSLLGPDGHAAPTPRRDHACRRACSFTRGSGGDPPFAPNRPLPSGTEESGALTTQKPAEPVCPARLLSSDPACPGPADSRGGLPAGLPRALCPVTSQACDSADEPGSQPPRTGCGRAPLSRLGAGQGLFSRWQCPLLHQAPGHCPLPSRRFSAV